MALKRITFLVLGLVLSGQCAIAQTEPIRGKRVVAQLKPEITPIVGDYVTAPKFDMDALGRSIAVNTFKYKREARVEIQAKNKTDHPVREKIAKWTGYRWFDNHVMYPTSDWWEAHSGFATGATAVGSVVTAGAVLGGRAK